MQQSYIRQKLTIRHLGNKLTDTSVAAARYNLWKRRGGKNECNQKSFSFIAARPLSVP